MSLILCGKVHSGHISVYEFLERVEKEYKKYGHRAELAEQNKGIDWKAISHGMRAISQMQMLLQNGQIDYPLKETLNNIS